MASFEIKGGNRLEGEVSISGGKNAALPLIAACLLTREQVVIKNCPRIRDVEAMIEIMRALGAEAELEGNTLAICAEGLRTVVMPRELSGRIRSSIFMLGAMAARMKAAEFYHPGGCKIGKRPIDVHLCALKQLGATICEKEGRIICRAEQLHGAVIHLACASVGATENAMMAATLADGITIIENAAREPEIRELQDFLVSMGGKISGGGTGQIIVQGVRQLHGTEWSCMQDRIEAGTYMVAAAAAKGDVFLRYTDWEAVRTVGEVLLQSGARVRLYPEGIRVQCSRRLRRFDIATACYPGFPTDMQAQMCALAAGACGTSIIYENIFESRFSHALELRKMGADIRLYGRFIRVKGVERLRGAQVTATDLRGGAALVIGGLTAEGTTRIAEIEKIERGYERLEEKMAALGGQIRRTD